MKSPDKVSSIMFTISWNQNSFIMGIQKQKEAKIEIDLNVMETCLYLLTTTLLQDPVSNSLPQYKKLH